ncbi:MAG: TonB-dependent receptor [Siphonobacter sp.]
MARSYAFLLFCFCLLSFPAVYAQAVGPAENSSTENIRKENSKISGSLVDSTGSKAVEFATVALYNKATNKLMDGTVADDKGKFTFTNVAPGQYKLLLSFVGYYTKAVDNLTVKKGEDLDLGVIKMTSSIKTLNEVTVTGQKALIEEKVDRLVYNAEKDISSRGGDASDVLRKVPMLTVDLDGNVSMRGSSNIKVLINNKPSTIVASSVADALKQIPADQIASVEVITSPSAKYDAEGTGGIVNIITKKNNLQGFNLNVDSGVGNRGASLALNGNYRTGKVGFSLGGFGRGNYNTKTNTALNQTSISDGVATTTDQTGTGTSSGLFGHYNLGFDYDISKNQSITAGVRYGVRNQNNQQDYITKLLTDNVLTSTTLRDVATENHSGTLDANIDYVHTFKPQQEWSISTLYSRTGLNTNYDADLLNASSELTSRQRNLNHNINQEITLQTDYQTPIQKNQMLEFGVKGIFRQVNSNYQYLVAQPTGSYYEQESNPAGYLNYNQNIAAAYAAYTYTTKNKYTFKVGTRYEYTSIDASTSTSSSIDIPNYSNLVPSLNISKSLKSGMVKFAYNRRIQRPGIQQLNPNINAANTQSISVGNPYLKPELTNNVELGYSKSANKVFFNAAVFGRITNNSITQIRTTIDTLAGSILTTYQNIGSEHAVGVNIFAKFDISPKISFDFFTNSYYTVLSGTTTDLDGLSINAKNSGINVDFGTRWQGQFAKNWGIQAFGMIKGPQVQLQGRQGGFGFYSLGVKKDFNDKKSSVGLALENFLSSNIHMRTNLSSPAFTQISDTYMYNRGIRLTFSHKIGKMTMQSTRKKTKSVSNDDIKGDGGGDNNNSGNSENTSSKPK